MEVPKLVLGGHVSCIHWYLLIRSERLLATTLDLRVSKAQITHRNLRLRNGVDLLNDSGDEVAVGEDWSQLHTVTWTWCVIEHSRAGIDTFVAQVVHNH